MPNLLNVIVLAAVLLSAGGAHAERTIHVAPDGDASAQGSAGEPMSLQAALDTAAQGEAVRVVLADGRYRGQYTVRPGQGALTLEAATPGAAVLTGSDEVTWSDAGEGIYRIDWPHQLPLGKPLWKHKYKPQRDLPARRREMLFIDGQRLTQRVNVSDDGQTAGPVDRAQLQPGEFTVDDTAGAIFFRPPAGMALSDQTRVEAAVRGETMLDIVNRSNVTLRGLVFEHSANYIHSGYMLNINTQGPKDLPPGDFSSNILIEHCRFDQSNGGAVRISRVRDMTIRNCTFNNNGERGLSMAVIRDSRIEDCQFNGNNWRFGEWMHGIDAAGMKLLDGQPGEYTDYGTDNLLFLRCQFNDNNATGFWQDYGGDNVTLDHCLIQNNTGGGLEQEMTFGKLTVKDSVIRHNCGWNILGYGSPNIHIESSYIYGVRSCGFAPAPQFCRNIAIIGDDRPNGDRVASSENWSITDSVIIATEPKTNNWYFNWYGKQDPPPSWGKQALYRTLTSDRNTWYRRDQSSPPFPAVFPSDQTFGDYRDSFPDATWEQWRSLSTADGKALDANSHWQDADLDDVSDPTVTQHP